MASVATPRPRLVAGAVTYARELWRRREFAWYLAMGNLRARNASTTLGLLWWVVNPMLLGGIYALVFGGILKISRGMDDYIAYLLAGMFAFHYTRSAMVGGVNMLLSNTKLIANLRFPRLILPLSAVIEAAAGFAASLVVFFPIAFVTNGVVPGSQVWLLVPAVLIHTVFNFGLAALAGRIAVPFRDVNNLIPYGLRLWLYLTPIIYPLSFVDGLGATAQALIRANPMYSIVAVYRSALLGYPVVVGELVAAAAWAVGTALVATYLFARYEGQMAKYV